MSSLTLTTFLLAVVEDRCQCVGDSGDDDQHGDLQIRTKQTKTVLYYKSTHDFTQI